MLVTCICDDERTNEGMYVCMYMYMLRGKRAHEAVSQAGADA